MHILLQDFRYGLRTLAKSPAFAATAVLTLALGIGANTTIFSWISSNLLNPIPGVTHTGKLIAVMRGERSEHPTPPFSYPDYVELRDRNRSLSGLLAYHDDWMSLTGSAKPERIYGTLNSANYFDVLGVRPFLGRGFLPAEERTSADSAVVVISYGLWQSHYGADRSVIGRTIHINRHLYTIIGVAPPGFQGCVTGLRSDLWIPLAMDRHVWGSKRIEERGTFWLNLLGRLRPGVGRRQAEKELDLQMRRIVEQFPTSHRGPNEITLDPLWRSPFGVNVYLYKTLPMLLALAGVLLLLACANVANLLLVRSVGRRREIAIRLSIGATRWQLVRQLLIESLLLALAGGGVAIVITIWSAGTFAAFFPKTGLPLTLNGHTDRSVLLATTVASVLTALIFGMLPALRSSSVPLLAVLKEEGGTVSAAYRKARLSSGLVVMQISLSLLLLICSGLFARSLRNAQQADFGFDPNHVLVASYELAPAGYSEAQALAFDRQLLAKLESQPGIESASLADFTPLSFTLHSDVVIPDGYVSRPDESMEIDRAVTAPGYLRTMRIPVIAGREFTAQDAEKSQPVAIINQEFAARYWPQQDAIGKKVSLYGRWLTVVGVAGNGRYRRVVYAPEPIIFVPLFQDYRDLVIIHVRTSGNPQALASAIERTVHELNPELPVFNVITLKEAMELGSIFERIAATFAGSFGLLALVLAGVGLYGVVAYTTRQRTREIGIRMALGANRGDVLRLVLGRGLQLALVGLAIGITVSLGVTRLLRSQLFGVAPADVLTYAGVSVVLSIVALTACYIPARRATRIQPTAALRSE
jgi:predicted permease